MTAPITKFKKIGLIGRYKSDINLDTLSHLIQLLQDRCEILLEIETAEALSVATFPSFEKNALAQHCDLIVVVGGDGSLLGAARVTVDYDVPVLGINRGGLGFLADIKPCDLESELLKVLSGQYQEEKRFLLEAVIENEKKPASQPHSALNDVVLMPGDAPQILEFDIYINGQFMCTQKADGMIVSTPTGSTAYALSSGGPILYPQLDALVLVPLCPHKLSSRPIVLNGNDTITIVISPNNTHVPQLSCDGQERFIINPGGKITVTKKNKALRLIHPISYNYFEILRNKLGWEA